jgi:serine protease Do
MKGSEGALVTEPQANGPAAKAGILSGDVITAVDGHAVKDARDLARQIGAMAPGATTKLSIWRKGEEKSISLTLGELPKERAAMTDSAPQGTDTPRLGLTLAPAAQVAGGGAEGVVITNVDPSGPASEHGVKTGDVILDVGGKAVATPADVRNAISDAHKNGKRTVLLRMKSNDTTKFVAIPLARA